MQGQRARLQRLRQGGSFERFEQQPVILRPWAAGADHARASFQPPQHRALVGQAPAGRRAQMFLEQPGTVWGVLAKCQARRAALVEGLLRLGMGGVGCGDVHRLARRELPYETAVACRRLKRLAQRA